eukprot:11784830-Ditylum_brightwellii.AAC.1
MNLLAARRGALLVAQMREVINKANCSKQFIQCLNKTNLLKVCYKCLEAKCYDCRTNCVLCNNVWACSFCKDYNGWYCKDCAYYANLHNEEMEDHGEY